MKIDLSPPRGMRDWYPDEYRLRQWLFDAWRAEATLHGFEFVDAPVVENLALLERKAGEEIAEQLYAFADKSQRQLALRAEFTPSLARMVLNHRELLSSTQRWTAIARGGTIRAKELASGREYPLSTLVGA